MHSLASHLEKLKWEEEKKRLFLEDECVSEGVSQLQPSYPGVLPGNRELAVPVGKYLVPLASLEGEPSSTSCLDTSSGEQLSCRVYNLKFFQSKSALFGTDTKGVHSSREVLLTNSHAFVFSKSSYGDLHQYLKEKKKLKEVEAASLFRQIVELVKYSHSCGIALRDIKLKKFIFEDVSRTVLSLHYLDDAQLMEQSGLLADRHGCPAYVCPEMLQPGSYSGNAADLWSLGVILYTLLVGHYPFFDSSTQNLFSKVRSGYYQIPEHVSELARSLIGFLLAYEPSSRLPAWAVLEHAWFGCASDENIVVALGSNSLLHLKDQTVPAMFN